LKHIQSRKDKESRMNDSTCRGAGEGVGGRVGTGLPRVLQFVQ
jgi:hypothetical protein